MPNVFDFQAVLLSGLFDLSSLLETHKTGLTLAVFTVGFLLTYGTTCVVVSLIGVMLKTLLFFKGIKQKKTGELKPIGFPAALLQTLPIGAIWILLLIILGFVQVYIPVVTEKEASIFHITSKFLIIMILAFVLLLEGAALRLMNRGYVLLDIVIFTMLGAVATGINYAILFSLLRGFY